MADTTAAARALAYLDMDSGNEEARRSSSLTYPLLPSRVTLRRFVERRDRSATRSGCGRPLRLAQGGSCSWPDPEVSAARGESPLFRLDRDGIEASSLVRDAATRARDAVSS